MKYRYDISLRRLVETDGQHLTKEQQEYFKDSKIRDRDGDLVQCFHYTDRDFDAFDKAYITEDSYCGRGFYFTSMTGFGSGFGKNCYECYIDMKNPLVVEDLSDRDKIYLLDYFAESQDYKNGDLPRISGHPQEEEIEWKFVSFVDMIDYSPFKDNETIRLIENLKNISEYSDFLESKNIEDILETNEMDSLLRNDEFKEQLEEHGLSDYAELEVLHFWDLAGDKFHYGYWNAFSARLTEWAKEYGYDGILSESNPDCHVREIVVFEANQIKSVDCLYPTKSDNFRGKTSLMEIRQIVANNREKKTLAEIKEVAKSKQVNESVPSAKTYALAR